VCGECGLGLTSSVQEAAKKRAKEWEASVAALEYNGLFYNAYALVAFDGQSLLSGKFWKSQAKRIEELLGKGMSLTHFIVYHEL